MGDQGGRRFICVHIIGVGLGLSFVLVLCDRNECREGAAEVGLDLVSLIKEGVVLLLPVNLIQTQWVAYIHHGVDGRERERQIYTFRFCDASGKGSPMWFNVPLASHTRGRRVIEGFQWCAFVC